MKIYKDRFSSFLCVIGNISSRYAYMNIINSDKTIKIRKETLKNWEYIGDLK